MELHDEMLSMAEAGELLGVAPETVRAWVHRGDLAAVRVGRSLIRVSRADVLGLVRPVEYRQETRDAH